MKKLLSLTLILILSAGIFTGCKKDKGDPPALPPMESMSIDFSNFTSSKKGSDILSDQKGTNTENWDFAAEVADVWNDLITNTFGVPVTSFKRASGYDPKLLSDNTWQWSYTVNVASASYTVRLTGQVMTSEVVWKLYVSGSFAEFVWVEGTSKLDRTSGQWILDESSASQTPALQIDWNQTNNSISSIKYTYVKSGVPFNTSFIDYKLVSGNLNALYDVYYHNGIAFSNVDIEWNTSTHNGRVKSLDYLLGEWYCWNEQKINDTCP